MPFAFCNEDIVTCRLFVSATEKCGPPTALQGHAAAVAGVQHAAASYNIQYTIHNTHVGHVKENSRKTVNKEPPPVVQLF